MMNANHELVLRYVEEPLAWRIRPCHRGEKRPLAAKAADGAWRAFEASNDPDQVRVWLKQYPYANWQVRCDGIVVVDAERQAAARQLRGIFEAAGSEFPRSPTVETGGWSAGQHVYFARPKDRALRGQFWLRNDIEVRASRMFCLLPPSLHPETGVRYQWLSGHSPFCVPLPELPPWLCELMAPVPVPEYKPLPVEKLGDRYVQAAIESEASEMTAATPGDRNNALFRRTARLCQKFVDNGLADEQTIREEMLAAGVAAGLSEIEARRTVLSASRAARART